MTKWFVFIDGRLMAEAESRQGAEDYRAIEQHKRPAAKIEIEKRRVGR